MWLLIFILFSSSPPVQAGIRTEACALKYMGRGIANKAGRIEASALLDGFTDELVARVKEMRGDAFVLLMGSNGSREARELIPQTLETLELVSPSTRMELRHAIIDARGEMVEAQKLDEAVLAAIKYLIVMRVPFEFVGEGQVRVYMPKWQLATRNKRKHLKPHPLLTEQGEILDLTDRKARERLEDIPPPEAINWSKLESELLDHGAKENTIAEMELEALERAEALLHDLPIPTDPWLALLRRHLIVHAHETQSRLTALRELAFKVRDFDQERRHWASHRHTAVIRDLSSNPVALLIAVRTSTKWEARWIRVRGTVSERKIKYAPTWGDRPGDYIVTSISTDFQGVPTLTLKPFPSGAEITIRESDFLRLRHSDDVEAH